MPSRPASSLVSPATPATSAISLPTLHRAHEPPPPRIIGIGIDLAEPSRVARSIQHRRFAERVFAPVEISRFMGTPPDLRALAGAFALKEALLKALGTGWTQGIAFHEIVGTPLERPETLVLRGRAREVAERLGVTEIAASVSVAGDVAVGSVILWGRKDSGSGP